MNVSVKAMTMAALCMSFTQIIRPETVRVKLYKTDPTTWNKPFYYVVQTAKTSVTERQLIRPPLGKNRKQPVKKLPERTPEITTTVSHSLASYKPIKKDVTITFDTEDENVLWICPTPVDDDKVCGHLILSTNDSTQKPVHDISNVIAIDKDYKPTSMSKNVVDRIIKDNQAKFFKMPVYKEDRDTWGQKWTISLLDGYEKEYPDAKVVILKDSFFKKLWVQKNIEPGSTYVRVRKPTAPTVVDTPLEDRVDVPWEKRLLVIDKDGHARIENISFKD